LLAYSNREAAFATGSERNHRDGIAAEVGGERLEARQGGARSNGRSGPESRGPERNDVSVLEFEVFWLGGRYRGRRRGCSVSGRRAAGASKRNGRGENNDTDTTGCLHASLRWPLHIRSPNGMVTPLPLVPAQDRHSAAGRRLHSPAQAPAYFAAFSCARTAL